MFSKEMETLIEAVLQDGVLTDQEKAVLVKRAEKEGVDIDELDVYIQSLLQKRHQEEAAEDAKADRATKIGSVRRCPNCGYNVPSGFAACPQCGQTFNVTETSDSWEKLQDKLNSMKAGFWDTGLGKRKDEVIINFPVPNTRADLLEFLSSLQPKAKNKKRSFLEDDDASALASPYAYWQLYCNCINKARISFSNDSSFQFFFDFYEKENEKENNIKGFFAELFGK